MLSVQKRGRIIPNTIIVNLLKKLGVECPGCSEDFVNKTAADDVRGPHGSPR